MALVDKVLDAQVRTQGEMVRLLESEDAGHSLSAPLELFIRKCGRHTAGRFQSPFDDFLGRAAYTAGERRLEQFLAVR